MVSQGQHWAWPWLDCGGWGAEPLSCLSQTQVPELSPGPLQTGTLHTPNSPGAFLPQLPALPDRPGPCHTFASFPLLRDLSSYGPSGLGLPRPPATWTPPRPQPRPACPPRMPGQQLSPSLPSGPPFTDRKIDSPGPRPWSQLGATAGRGWSSGRGPGWEGLPWGVKLEAQAALEITQRQRKRKRSRPHPGPAALPSHPLAWPRHWPPRLTESLPCSGLRPSCPPPPGSPCGFPTPPSRTSFSFSTQLTPLPPGSLTLCTSSQTPPRVAAQCCRHPCAFCPVLSPRPVLSPQIGLLSPAAQHVSTPSRRGPGPRLVLGKWLSEQLDFPESLGH